ncbi:ATP/GTP-binding protein [Leucobacter komagatae]|uniref:ATP/GTP-binding protein n=1 Tax=Leucobacter komagatae TaxID=55969 RepID=A0A0D0II06_9MICO|nr:ATP/GTP-binding protein [Leucobacter komagatae]
MAVFGAAGSGKTVLLSSFYGAAVERQISGTDRFDVLAEDAGQRTSLYQNYLGMKKSGLVPIQTRYDNPSYAFAVSKRKGTQARSGQAAQDLRLVWHDYPGEWFEREPRDADEARRRTDTFRTLLTADVAVLLVDGQRLLDNAGEEERYLKALLNSFGTALQSLRADLLDDGKPLVTFPRIWLLALSKSDLLPDMDALELRELVLEKVGGEVNEFRSILRSFIEAPDALSFGDDFVLLSSAKFEPGKIEVATRVGLDLLLPIAAMLPFSRYVRWALVKRKGSEVALHLVRNAAPLAVLLNKIKLPGVLVKLGGPIAALVALLGPNLAKIALDLAEGKAQDFYDEAAKNHDFVASTLAGFQLDLDHGVEKKVLLRSPE